MAFLERLKQQQAAELASEHQVRTQQLAEIEAKRQADVAEKEFHEQRRQQAKAVYRDSGAQHLLEELRRLTGHGGGGVGEDPPNIDPDSVCESVVWDRRKIGTQFLQTHGAGPDGFPPGGEYFDVFEVKFIEVVSQPEGNIIFHANRDIIVSKQEWKNSKDILERSLEQSYNNPGIHKRF